MARDFDGTNDNLLAPDNSSPGMDNALISLAMWLSPSGTGTVLNCMTANGSGNGRLFVVSDVPTTSGWRLKLAVNFSGVDGDWRTTGDLAADTPTHCVITYDRSATTNDPVMYINGASVGVTENTTPTGTADAGQDTAKLGENAGGTTDYDGTIAHCVIHGGLIFDAAQANRAKWWGRPIGGLQNYYPFLTDKLANDGSETGATLTATGTTNVAFPVPTVRPGSACLGLGVGW